MKKSLAIFDLTDCEGCEVEFLSLREKRDFIWIEKNFEIKNWRLLSELQQDGPFDVAFVEGSPVSKKEIGKLKQIRAASHLLIALGACASIGGVPAILEEKHRQKLVEYVYGKNYLPKAINAKPIDHYVKVDFHLSGCPVNPAEIKEVLANSANDRPLQAKTYPVCLECKAKGNNCLLIDNNEPCLGAITKAGCGAICPAHGLKCYGCWGLMRDANFSAMIIALKKQGRHKREIKKIMDIFLEESEEYQEYLK